MNHFDLIIFDWDGTLIDTIPWIVSCLQKSAELCGQPIPEEQAARDVIGLSIQNAVATLFPDADPALQKRLVTNYSETYLSKQLSKDDLFDGVFEMLQQLKQQGYLLAVATGKTRSGLQEALRATGTEHLFCATRCADETASKPDPKMLDQIMAVAGVAPGRTLMVGDSVHDLQMAANAQVAAIAVCCGANSRDVLMAYRPLQCLSHPAQLLNFI